MCILCGNQVMGFGEDAVQPDPGFQLDGLWQTLVGAGVAPPVVELLLDRLTGDAAGGGAAGWLFGGQEAAATAGFAATGTGGDDADEITIPDAPADGAGESAPQAPAWQADLFGGTGGNPGAGVELGEIPNTIATTVGIEVGSGFVSSQIEVDGDSDWIRVELEAGKTYSIRMNGSGQTPLFDPRIYLRDFEGTYQAGNDDASVGFDGQTSNFGAANRGAHLLYTATQTGTYYIDANAFGSYTGSYTVLVDEVPATGATPGIPSTSLIWGGRTFDNTISVYFGGAGEVFDGRTSLGWQQWQIDQTMAALQTFSGFTNLTFTLTNTAAGSDFQIITVNDPNLPASAYFNPPGETNAGVGVWNFAPASYLADMSTQWNVGSGAWHTMIHEFGHGFGLSHTHDRGGLSNVMNGVSSSNGDYGDFDLNQGPFTMMGYNYSYATGWNGPSSDLSVGFNVNAGTLDVAILQRLYGANQTANGGNTVYTLSDTPGGFVTIWDTGGIDEIRYNGSGFTTIALQAATLDYAAGGGGVVSEVQGVQGGFVIAAGAAIENATGGSGVDFITGNELANVLEGRGGSDAVFGFGGNDTIIADAQFDSDYYDGGDDVDTFDVSQWTWTVAITIDLTTETWSFPGFTEAVVNFENVNGGNQAGALIETIIGNGLANALYGNGGNDVLNGLGGSDTLSGGLGNDELYGGADADFLFAGAGNDLLNGGGGADAMTGGLDNDTYYVDNVGDTVIEWAGGGNDTVRSTISHTLAAEVENLVLLVGSNLNGTGNGLANFITGNTGNNVLTGLAGSDTLSGGLGNDELFGGGGDDTLFAGAGNDLLNGGSGADAMTGGLDNDTYVVDDAGDTVIENAGGGNDTVNASISFTLGAEVENLILTGAANLNGTGNGLANFITGNTGNNVLNGAAGADTLSGGLGDDELYGGADADTLFAGAGNDLLNGGAGADAMTGGLDNDTYFVDDIGDTVIENAGGGNDTVRSTISHTLATEVENLVLLGGSNLNGTGNTLDNFITGNTGNNVLNGGAGADTLSGGLGNDDLFGGGGGDQLFAGAGNDVLNGGGGNDTLTGGLDADVFVFNTALNAATNVDTITDYSVVDDTIHLDDAIFSALGLGALLASAFRFGAAAVDADDRIIYQGSTGNLFYDVDGVGGVAQVQFASLTAGLAMSHNEFVVI